MIPWDDIFVSVKASLGVAGATTLSGVGLVLGMIPDNIGKLAALLGCILTFVLIKYWCVQIKKGQLENELLMRKLRAPEGE